MKASRSIFIATTLICVHHLSGLCQQPTQEAKGNLPKILALSPQFLNVDMEEVNDFWSKNKSVSRGNPPWESIGPNVVQSGEGLNFFVSGRVKHIDYIRKDLIRFVSASGGLFEALRTEDKWDIKNISVHEVTTTWGGASDTSPFDHNFILYGTGDHLYGRGSGLWKTSNGGASWQRINLPNAQYFHDVKFSNKAGKIWAGGNGLYSSEDNGDTWKTHRYGDFSSVVIDPNRPDTVFVSDFAKGIFRTFDGGNTWTKLSNGLPTDNFHRIELTLCDDHPNVLYAWICNEKNATKGVWKTTDHGQSWKECIVLNSEFNPVDNLHLSAGDFHSTISVSPTDPNKVLIGGWWYAISGDGEIFIGPNSGSHEDYHYATWDDEGETIFIATDGGITYMHFDNITIFEDNVAKLNTELIKVPTLQFLSVSTGKDSKFIVGGTQDNGFIFYNSERSNWFYSRGDGSDVSAHYDVDHTFHGAVGVYGAPLVFRNVGKFSENPTDFHDINEGLRPSGEWFRRVGNTYGPEIILFTQTDHNFYYSTNLGFRWKPYDVPDFDVNSINAMCSPHDIYPHVFVSGDGSPRTSIMKVDMQKLTHEFVSDGLPILKHTSWPQVYTSPSPLLRHKVFSFIHAPVGHSPTAKIFMSNSDTISWVNITGNLPDVPITTMFVHPEDPNFIMVGTDGFGVFTTQDGGISWISYNTDLPKGCLITDFDYQRQDGKLYVIMATYGNGLYRSALPASTVNTSQEILDSHRMAIYTYGEIARIFLSHGVKDDVLVEIIDLNGNIVTSTSRINLWTDQMMELTIPSLPDGIYVFRVTSGNDQYIEKTIIKNK